MPHLAHFTFRTLGAAKKLILVRPYSHNRACDENPHDHDFIEIALVSRGEGLHVTKAGISPISRGSVIVIPPGAWHDYREPRNLKVYDCCFPPELLRHELAWLIEDPIFGAALWTDKTRGEPRESLFHLQENSTRWCCDLAADLSSFLRDSPLVSRAEAVARLRVYFTALSSSLSQKAGNLEKATKATHPAVMHCLQQIEADLARDWTVPELARSTRISREHLTRLFKQKTGRSPIAFLDQRRADQVAHLLEKTTLSLKEIGARVGWGSPVTLSRRFKAHHGITATAYRERLVSTLGA